MGIDDLINPFLIARRRSEWYQCAQCLSDLRVSEHQDDCPLNEAQRVQASNHVRTIIKSYYNTKGIEVLKGGK